MNKSLTLVVAAALANFLAGPAYAHHPAADIVDEDTYAMIDDNVADTPHADLNLDEQGNAMDRLGTEDNGAMVDAAETSLDSTMVMELPETDLTMEVMD